MVNKRINSNIENIKDGIDSNIPKKTIILFFLFVDVECHKIANTTRLIGKKKNKIKICAPGIIPPVLVNGPTIKISIISVAVKVLSESIEK